MVTSSPFLPTNVSPHLIKLEQFIIGAKYEDLPDSVLHDTKFILLDSIGCALAGITTDLGKMTLSLTKRLGGMPESSIIGTGEKVSCFCAALVNGDLIRTVDHSIFPHLPAFIIPPSLAIAESTNTAGQNLILALTLGFEVMTRVTRALGGPPGGQGFKGPDAIFVRPKRVGKISASTLGATAGAAKLLNFNQDQLGRALGLASHFSQGTGGQQVTYSPHRTMTKWGYAGWQSAGAILSVLLAEVGYPGDTAVFDPENNAGYEKWQPDKLADGLGETWNFTKFDYKPYPGCRLLNTPLDCFISIIGNNNLVPEEIDCVKVYGHPDLEYPFFTNREITNIVDMQYSVPLSLALAAYRVKVGPEWQDWDTMTDPKIVAFTDKVSLHVHPEFGKKSVAHPGSYLAKVEVAARGQIYSEERLYSKGTKGTEYAMTDEEVLGKFRHNASRILTQEKINGAVTALLNLEKIKNVSALVRLITR